MADTMIKDKLLHRGALARPRLREYLRSSGRLLEKASKTCGSIFDLRLDYHDGMMCLRALPRFIFSF